MVKYSKQFNLLFFKQTSIMISDCRQYFLAGPSIVSNDETQTKLNGVDRVLDKKSRGQQRHTTVRAIRPCQKSGCSAQWMMRCVFECTSDYQFIERAHCFFDSSVCERRPVYRRQNR